MAEKVMDEQDGFLKNVSNAIFGNSGVSAMEVDETPDQYNFNHAKRGIAVVIVNETFDGHKNRAGAEKDQVMLADCFRTLRFDVRVFVNLNGYEMLTKMEQITKEMSKNPDFDCFVFAMSSHGDKVQTKMPNNVQLNEDVIHATDGYIQTSRILELFSDEKCSALIGKPRMFFLQACRGNQFDKGVTTVIAGDEVDGLTCEPLVITPVPCQKDFIIMYATPHGFYAFRRPSQGSWFVIKLCHILSQANSEKANLCKLLRWVTKAVGCQFQSESADLRYHAKKQSPVIYSMLVKDVIFN